MALKRLIKELKDVDENPSPFYDARPLDPQNMFFWEGFVIGPPGTPY